MHRRYSLILFFFTLLFSHDGATEDQNSFSIAEPFSSASSSSSGDVTFRATLLKNPGSLVPVSSTDVKERDSDVFRRNQVAMDALNAADAPRSNHPASNVDSNHDADSKLFGLGKSNLTAITMTPQNGEKVARASLSKRSPKVALPVLAVEKDAKTLRSELSTIDACPAEWTNPRDHFAQPRGENWGG